MVGFEIRPGAFATEPTTNRVGRSCRVEPRRRLEDDPLSLTGGIGVVVARVDRDLVLAAHDERRASEHDERPERVDLGICERRDGIEGLDERQCGQWAHRVVVQNRRAGDGELGNAPAIRGVPEVDDPRDRGSASWIGRADDIVIGQVSVQGLDRQQSGERRERGADRLERVGQELAPTLVGNVVQEARDHLFPATQVPLQLAFEPWMHEIGERDRNGTREPPQIGHGSCGQMLEVDHRCAVDETQEPDVVGPPVDVDGRDRRAVGGCGRHRHGQP